MSERVNAKNIAETIAALPDELPGTDPIKAVNDLFDRHQAGEIDLEALRAGVLAEVQDLLDGQAW